MDFLMRQWRTTLSWKPLVLMPLTLCCLAFIFWAFTIFPATAWNTSLGVCKVLVCFNHGVSRHRSSPGPYNTVSGFFSRAVTLVGDCGLTCLTCQPTTRGVPAGFTRSACHKTGSTQIHSAALQKGLAQPFWTVSCVRLGLMFQLKSFSQICVLHLKHLCWSCLFLGNKKQSLFQYLAASRAAFRPSIQP